MYSWASVSSPRRTASAALLAESRPDGGRKPRPRTWFPGSAATVRGAEEAAPCAGSGLRTPRTLPHVRRLRRHVLQCRQGISSTGMTAEVSASHLPVLDAQRESVLPETGLQPVVSVGPDRGCDSRDFAAECRDLNITPHVAQKKRWSSIDGRKTCHESYRASRRFESEWSVGIVA